MSDGERHPEGSEARGGASGTIATTPRLRLRELTHEDGPFVMQLVNDPDWLRFIGDRNVHSLGDAHGYVDRVRASYASNGFGLWLVEPLSGGAALGIAGLLQRDTLEHPDLGFAFLPAARGQGIASEAAEAVLDLARVRHGLARVLAITDPGNTASQRVLERVGFRFERRFTEPSKAEELCLFGRDLS